MLYTLVVLVQLLFKPHCVVWGKKPERVLIKEYLHRLYMCMSKRTEQIPSVCACMRVCLRVCVYVPIVGEMPSNTLGKGSTMRQAPICP